MALQRPNRQIEYSTPEPPPIKMPHHRSLATEQKMPALQPGHSDLLDQPVHPSSFQNPVLTPIVFVKHHPEHAVDPNQQYVMMNGTLGTLGSVHSLTTLPEV